MVPKRNWKEILDARDTSEKLAGPYRSDELGAIVLLSGCYRVVRGQGQIVDEGMPESLTFSTNVVALMN